MAEGAQIETRPKRVDHGVSICFVSALSPPLINLVFRSTSFLLFLPFHSIFFNRTARRTARKISKNIAGKSGVNVSENRGEHD